MVGRIITITSGKGGVGKTTITGNIAFALANRKQRVACLDLDIGLRNLDLILGLENRIVYDLLDVIEGRVRWKQAVVRHKNAHNLFLLPTAQWREKDSITDIQITQLCQDMISEFDFIFIDCPAGIDRGFFNAIAPADETIVIATPEVSSIRDAARVIDLVIQTKKNKPQLILNRVRQHMIDRHEMLNVSDCLDLLKINLIGLVFEDPSVIVHTNWGIPTTVAKQSKAGREFDRIARRLLGDTVPLQERELPPWHKRVFAIFDRH